MSIELTRLIELKSPTAIIFDCDGTLTHSMPLHFVAWKETLLKYGITFTEERFYSLAGVPTDKIIRMLASEQRIDVDPKSVGDEKEEAFVRNMHLLGPIPAVVDFAKEWVKTKPAAVASGGFREIVKTQLRHLGILDLFGAVVAAEDTVLHKPEPDVFLEAAKRLEIPPTQCCVLEDSELGFEAARRAGMTYVDVRPFYPH